MQGAEEKELVQGAKQLGVEEVTRGQVEGAAGVSGGGKELV